MHSPYKGGVVIAHPDGPGKFVVVETNVRDPRLVPGESITSADIADLVNRGARVLVQRKGEKL